MKTKITMKLNQRIIQKLLLSTIFVFLAGTLCSQQLPELLYYKFDVSGTSVINHASSPVGNNPATVTGLTIGSTGLSGTALVGTNGSSSSNKVTTGWSTGLTGSWTIAFWTSSMSGTGIAYIFGDPSASSFRCFTNGAAGANNWLVRAGGLPDLQITGGATSGAKMNHVVRDFTAGTYKAYVNGVLVKTINTTAAFSTTGTGFTIGGYSSSAGLNGNLDEFRIYNRALGQAEITATYNTTIGGTTVQTDLGILSWDYPNSSCGMSSAEPITIKVKNYGTVSQNSYTLKYSINGGTSWISQAMTTAILPDSILTHTFTTPANFASAGTYNCLAKVVLPLDSNSNNDSLTKTVIATAAMATPYFNNLESMPTGYMTTGDWISSTTSNPAWQIDVSNTGSSNTGPNKDHTLGTTVGKYAYLETSGGSLGSTSYLTSPCVNFGSVNAVVLNFWYHMYGSTMGTLEVQQKVGGTWVTTGWSKTGQKHSSMAAAWSEATVSINANADGIRFKGVRGSNYYSDMAIDDIKLYVPMPNDLAMIAWTSPVAGTPPSATMPVTVQVFNAGTAAQDTIPLKYSINGGTSWVSGVSYPTLLPGDTLTYTFTTTANMATPGYYNCKAVVSNPGDGAAVNDSIFVNPYLCTALTGTYLIGSSTSADFPSFSDAVFALNNCGVSGPVVMNVETGTYTEQVVIGAINGASATNTVTFKSLTGTNTDVTLQYSSASSGAPWTVRLNGANYIAFKNMTILATGATYKWVLDITNSDYNTFEGNILQATGAASSSNSRIAYIYTGISNYNTFLNNKLIGGYYGIYCRGSSSTVWAKGNRFEGNEISGGYYYPMYLYYQDSVQVINNYIHGNLGPYAYGIYGNYMNNEYKIIGNTINLTSTGTSTCYGIRDYYSNYYTYNATPSGYGLIANNMISISGGNGNHYGIYSYYAKAAKYYYNSINIMNGGTTSRCLYQYNTALNTPGQTFKNNIFVNKGLGYAAYFNTPTMVAASDYNCYYSASNYFVYWTGNKTTLTALQTASSKDANSISVNPGFHSATDLHLNDAAIDGNGTPITGITTDIDGEARNGTTPDIGADEFTLIYHDAGIVSLEGPVAPCPGSAAYVEVKLQNFGLTNLSSCLINWTVNGSPQTSFSFSGTLPYLGDTTLTIGSYTFAAATLYDIKVWSSSPNAQTDQKTSNDTLFVNGMQSAMPSGTYTIGPDVTDDFSSFTAAVNAMITNGICGAVIFNVDSGTYNEQITIPEILGTSATNTITFKSATGINTDVVLTYASTSSVAPWTLQLISADYLTFKNMTILGTGATYGNAVDLADADHNTFEGNILQVTGSNTSSNKRVVYVNTGVSNFNTFLDNKIIGGYYGIRIYGGSSALWGKGNVIDGNEFTGNYYYPLYVYYQDSVQIIDNYIHGNTGPYAYGIYGNYLNNAYKIVGNKVEITTTGTSIAYGIRDYYSNYYTYNATPSGYGLVANNMVTISGGNGNHYGIYSYYARGSKYYYNSINIMNGGTLSRGVYQYNTTSNTPGQTFKNNIFVNKGLGYAAYFNTPAMVAASDYNCFYTASSTYFVYWSGNKTTLTALQTASSKDANSISVDPMFTSATDLHITLASPNNSGTPITAVTVDIDGETRSLTTPDMGADEWDPLAHDLLISELLSPNSSICGSTTDTIKVVLNNWGLNTETNVPVIATVNTPTGTVSANTIVSSIAAGVIDTIIVGTVNTTTPGNYTITAYPTLATDLDHTNDTVFGNTMTNMVYAVPHMEDFTTAPYEWQYEDNTVNQIGTGHGLTSNALSVDIWDTYTTGYAFFEHKIGPVPANAYLTFDYRIVDFVGNGATVLDQDTINLYLSDDCGLTPSLVYTIDTNNHVPSTSFAKVMVPLTAFVGDDVFLEFDYIWNSPNSSHDIWIDIDNVGIGVPPVADLGLDTSICLGDTFTFDAGTNTVYTLSYNWYIVGNSSSLGTSQYFGADSAGTYYVVVTNEYGLSDADSVVLSTLPSPTVTMTGLAASYCVDGMTSTLTGTPTGGIFSGTGMTANVFDPAVAGVGTFDISYSFTNTSGCTGMAYDTAIVNPLPVIVASPDEAICFGDSTTISVLGPTTCTYLWSNAATTQSVKVSPAATTTYTVTVTDGNMCSTVDTVVVTVNPTPAMNLGPDANVCGSESMILDAGAGVGYVYLWSDNSTSQTITVDSTGFGLGTNNFWVMVTDSIGCYSVDTIELTFVSGAMVDLGADVTIKMYDGTTSVTLDAGTGFTSYVWDDMSIQQTRQIIGTVVLAGTHTYYVDVTDANGCMASDTVDVIVIDDIGINGLNNDNSVSLFPNPTKGMFNISINGINGNIDMQILDASGRLISNEKLIGIKSGYIKEFDVSYLAKGIYYIKLMNNDIIKLEKLVIQ